MNGITPADWSYTEYARLPGSIKDDETGLAEAAKQFESLFINMWLKSAREANAAIAENSPFSSNELEMQQQMFDSQMAMHLSKEGGIGLAPTIIRQLRGGVDQPIGSANSTNIMQTPDRQSALSSQAEASTQKIDTYASATRASLFANPEDFVNSVGPHIKKVMSAIGIPPLAVMAQAALETGWGGSVIANADGQSSHNLFGVKGTNWEGPTVEIHSKEFLLGQWSDKVSSFRAYPNLQAGIRDYAQMMSNSPRYDLAQADSIGPEQYVDKLQQGGYATDPAYAQKIKAIMQRLTGLGF